MKWFLYHLDNQNVDKNLHGLIVDKVELEPHHANWVNGKDKAIFPKMKKGDSLIATQSDKPIGVFNWELSLHCPKCGKYHYKYEKCYAEHTVWGRIILILGKVAALFYK